jgi:DNA polymerase III delta prime subunit
MKDVVWMEKYRPKTIGDYVFSDSEIETQVRRWYDIEKIDGNVLFYGPPGTGKTTLSEILIRDFIKSNHDLYIMKTRSVNEIDEIKKWQQQRPVKSSFKIVYIEEFDKIRSAEAKATLKSEMMEKYINHCIFICCTNYIRRIESAIRSRFTYKFHLKNENSPTLFDRLKIILQNENIEYNEETLKQFVDKYYKKGIRNLINLLQTIVVNNNNKFINIKFDEVFVLEDKIVNLVLSIINKFLSVKPEEKYYCVNVPSSNLSVIQSEYLELVNILHNNDVDYESIFEELLDRIVFIPAKMIIMNYAENIESKLYSNIHFIGMIYEILNSMYKVLC